MCNDGAGMWIIMVSFLIYHYSCPVQLFFGQNLDHFGTAGVGKVVKVGMLVEVTSLHNKFLLKY